MWVECFHAYEVNVKLMLWPWKLFACELQRERSQGICTSFCYPIRKGVGLLS